MMLYITSAKLRIFITGPRASASLKLTGPTMILVFLLVQSFSIHLIDAGSPNFAKTKGKHRTLFAQVVNSLILKVKDTCIVIFAAKFPILFPEAG